jgi:hypothetical protein
VGNMDVDAARTEFERAFEDAGFDEDVVFIPYTKASRRVPRAAFHAPGKEASLDELIVLDDAGQRLMTGMKDRYRVACWIGMDDAVVRAVLRHELEHVRQWKWGGGDSAFVLALSEYETHDDVGYADLPANGQVYNLVPIELDANGAASRFIRATEGDGAADEWTATLDPGLFRRRPVPEPLETLPARLISYASVWPDALLRRLGDRVEAPGQHFDRVMPKGGELWADLQEDAKLIKLRRSVAATVPTAATIAQAPSLAEGWAPAKAAILAAVDRAREIAGLAPTPTGA